MVIPPALHAIYEDDHPFVVVRKPSQVGLTEFNLNLALHAADTTYAGRGVVLVALPTQEMADRISQARLTKTINESLYLRSRVRPEAGALRAPANVQRRAIGEGLVYFVGAENESQFSGIDADIVICDEFDLMKEETLSVIQARIRSSRRGRIIVTSTPTIEAFGVSRLYDLSDARRYELECPSCRSWQTPGFPDNVDWEREVAICIHCRAPLDPWRVGRWIADHPEETDLRGYQLSRLSLPNPPLREMRMAMEQKVSTNMETFYRQDLGVPWVTEDDRLTLDNLSNCAHPWMLNELAYRCRRTVMGVDVGKRLHVVIRGFFEDRWHLHKAFTCADFEELDYWLAYHGVDMCVVDALPESRAARSFFSRHPDKVRLCMYVPQGIGTHWYFADGVGYVRVPRTLAMDEMLHRFKSGQFAVPLNFRDIENGAYVAHLMAPVRVVEHDALGQLSATFKHTRPDDFAHAEVYATLATERSYGTRVFGLDFANHRIVYFDGGTHPDLVPVP